MVCFTLYSYFSCICLMCICSLFSSLYLTFMSKKKRDLFVFPAMSGWGDKNYTCNASVNNAIFTWVVVSIKMSLLLFIFFDVSVELYTVDLFCP